MSVDVRLPKKRKDVTGISASDLKSNTIVSPGDVITEDTGYMRGHGTYPDNDKLRASVAGVVERVNKLICVKPFKTRYSGEVGDVVVGRITEVGQKRWKVETFSRLDSILMLSSVNLPGGELRRRSAEDERLMRQFFTEGDLISVSLVLLDQTGLDSLDVVQLAEVQSVFTDGTLSLHTRSLKYGKLREGTLVRVAPTLVKRCKTHFHNLPCGATVILGNNGYIWISPLVEEDLSPVENADEAFARQDVHMKEISFADRETVARLCNCVVALAEHVVLLFDTSLMYGHEASLKYSVKELLKPEIKEEIADVTRQRLVQEL